MGKIAVCGTGPSIELYKPEYDLSIGVNDIWSKIQTDYIVCLDAKNRFIPERLKTINESKPVKFFSQLTDWSDRSDFQKIELLPYYPVNVCQLNIPQLPKSHCSPFVACVIAFKYFHATEIHLFGVDMVNHPNLKDQTLENIKVHFKNLRIALRQNGCDFVVHGLGILKNI
jgi:hypothetical protein